MKTLITLLSSASGLLLLSTMICGLWLKSQGATPESVQFHITIAIASIVLSLVTLGWMLFIVLRS